MFTFYDNTYGFEECVWNLCWNELLNKFITFYSWVPSYMENINNIPFSFNRDTSKWIAKLGTSHSENSFADGITLTNVILNNTNDASESVSNKIIPFKYLTKYGRYETINIDASGVPGFIAGLSLSNRVIPSEGCDYDIEFFLERDIYNNYKKFKIVNLTIDKNFKACVRENNDEAGLSKSILPESKFTNNVHLQALCFNDEYNPSNLYSELYYRNSAGNSYSDVDTNKTLIIEEVDGVKCLDSSQIDLPIFKDKSGKRLMIEDRDKMLNPDKIVTLLNIKSSIKLFSSNESNSINDIFNNIQSGYDANTSLIDIGQYSSTVAIIPKWNM